MPDENKFCTECGTPTAFRPPVAEPAPVAPHAPRPAAAPASPVRTPAQSWSSSRQYGPTSERQRVSGIGVVPSVEEGGLAGIQLAMVRS